MPSKAWPPLSTILAFPSWSLLRYSWPNTTLITAGLLQSLDICSLLLWLVPLVSSCPCSRFGIPSDFDRFVLESSCWWPLVRPSQWSISPSSMALQILGSSSDPCGTVWPCTSLASPSVSVLDSSNLVEWRCVLPPWLMPLLPFPRRQPLSWKNVPWPLWLCRSS